MSDSVPPNPLPCGCCVEMVESWNKVRGWYHIPYVTHCPLHAAAESFQAALRLIVAFEGQDAFCAADAARAALAAAAEGKVL